MTRALTRGRPRSAFRSWTETTLTASDSESLRYPGINNVMPSCFGCDNAIRSGTSARPVDSSMKARLTASTASRIEMDRRTSDWVSSLIIKLVDPYIKVSNYTVSRDKSLNQDIQDLDIKP